MENISIEDVTLDCNSNYEWKQVKGFEGIYDLRSDGLLYSHPRPHSKGGYTYGCEDRYLSFSLSKNGKETFKYAHILVYETFVGEIPNGYIVHHKDHNKHNNNIDNLELISDIEHRKMHSTEDYERKKERIIEGVLKKCTKSVLQFTKDGQFVAEYKSAYEAERQTGISQRHICDCCNNKPNRKTAGGYIWKYKNIN